MSPLVVFALVWALAIVVIACVPYRWRAARRRAGRASAQYVRGWADRKAADQ